jgi:transketolase
VVFPEDCTFEIGRGVTLKDGTDVTLIGTGLMTAMALEAAAELAARGIQARVLHMGSIKPLDEELVLKAARETGAIVTAEEHSVVGGLGGAVCEVLAEGCPVPVERVGMRDVFGQSGPAAKLLEHYGLTADKLVESAERILKRKIG